MADFYDLVASAVLGEADNRSAAANPVEGTEAGAQAERAAGELPAGWAWEGEALTLRLLSWAPPSALVYVVDGCFVVDFGNAKLELPLGVVRAALARHDAKGGERG